MQPCVMRSWGSVTGKQTNKNHKIKKNSLCVRKEGRGLFSFKYPINGWRFSLDHDKLKTFLCSRVLVGDTNKSTSIMTTREVTALSVQTAEATQTLARMAQFQLCELLSLKFGFDYQEAKHFISCQKINLQNDDRVTIYFTDLVGHTMITLSLALCDILSRKYNFDCVEATEFLGLSGYTPTPPPLARQKATDSDADVTRVGSPSGNKPKPIRGRRKARNGWLLFIKELRPLAKIQLAHELDCREDQIQSHEVMTALGVRWRALTDEQRVTWGLRARGECIPREELTGVSQSGFGIKV